MKSKNEPTNEQLVDRLQDIIMFDNIEAYDHNDLLELLTFLDHEYTNTGNSPASDQEYDYIRQYTNALAPTIGEDEYDVVGHVPSFNEVDLPIKMGGLVELQRGTSELANWLATVPPRPDEVEFVVVTEKLDGMSVQLVYDDNLQLVQAVTRGDGERGQDITAHVSRMKICTPITASAVTIRAEIIVSKANGPAFNAAVAKWRGKPYKNLRNGIAGCMGKEDTIPQDVLDLIHVVAYTIMDNDTDMDKTQQIKLLENYGFVTPKFVVTNTAIKESELIRLTELMIQDSEYELDGVVLDFNDAETRQQLNDNLRQSGLEPSYARKFKIATQALHATVTSVIWTESKHGYLKPRIEIEPIELDGTTITYATGFNAAFIRDNKIGKGAIIEIVRSGGVIPYVQAVISPASAAHLPSGDFTWTETNVDIVLVNKTSQSNIAQTVDFFKSLKIDFIGEGNARGLVQAGLTIADIINADELTIQEAVGSTPIGTKIFDSIQLRFAKPMYEYELAGSTIYFGRGVGVRRLKKLVEAHPTIQFEQLIADYQRIATTEGFADKIAAQITAGAAEYLKFKKQVSGIVKFEEFKRATGDLVGQSFVFTQVRDKAAENEIAARGGKIGSSVSKKTTYLVTNDISATTGKAQKAIENNVPMITIDELWEILKGEA